MTGASALASPRKYNLHFFTYDYAVDIADDAYSFNHGMDGIYLFWDCDDRAFAASTFTAGQAALAGIGGLAVGILGATLVGTLTKKRKDAPEAPAAA